MRIISEKLLLNANKEKEWAPSFKALGNNNWSAVAYGNGIFVALGESGAYATSADGVNWVSGISSALASLKLNAITFDGAKFAASSLYGDTATSINGIDWNTRTVTPSSSYRWNKLAYGNNTYVLCGYLVSSTTTGRVLRSLDLISYIGGNYEDMIWEAICFDSKNNIFVAIVREEVPNPRCWCYEGRGDFDSINWSQKGSLTYRYRYPQVYVGICYGNGKYIALTGNGEIATANYLYSWSETKINKNLVIDSSDAWSGIAYGDGRFLTISKNGYVSIKRD